MKKLVSIFLCINILCGCGGMRGLRRQDVSSVHKNIKKDGEWYYADNTGHNESVKMEVYDKYHANILIPVQYSEHIESPIPKKMPVVTLKVLNDFNQDAWPICKNCWLNRQHLILPVQYNQINKGECVGMSLLQLELTPIIILMALFSKDVTFSDIFSLPAQCVSELETGSIRIEVPWDFGYIQKLKEAGIDASFSITPWPQTISCDKKACEVQDGNGNIINDIKIHKNISFNQKRLKELLQQEKEEQSYQRNLQRWQERECPTLYNELILFRQGYVDPIEQVRVGRKFAEFKCSEWVNKQMYR